MKKILIITLIAIFMVSMILAGTSCTTKTSGTTTAKETALFKAGVVLPTMNVFYLALQNGVVDAVTAAGGKAIVLISQQYKVPVELANVEDLLQQGIDVLFIDASDAVASAPAIQAANKAKVPVIGINQRPQGGEFVTVVAT